ncbi:mannobiose 2-epimerase [Pustulibacterium marinum]|uniref:Cellobiose 2-epimerase n=1 Tax=Pustulibacterium marinum TaxID=1224947 RepID=A0A1I7GFX0_9FLAO|nr:AGE family epimerase/isomerase [Pustulibacterium marinum]SFU47335.1 mannobiose 2-epimerase [Pustulibacterium marinum]
MEPLKNDMKIELQRILNYWSTNMIDKTNGGFIGTIDYNNIKHPKALKGAVLNARILWTFSAAYQLSENENEYAIAQRAFKYIKECFYDTVNKGIYWSVNVDGTPSDTKNQIYALGFTIYGLSEYYKISQDQEALDIAINLYKSIQTHSLDTKKGGYFEAYTQDWEEISDMRLSDKDANEKKTMNTHLHIVEGFANLYLVWKNEELKNAIIDILNIIDEKFIDKNTWHLKLFFNEDWVEKPDVISYGHDIEAAWLLQWCAEVTKDSALIENFKHYAIEITKVTNEGIDKDGGLWYEYNPQEKQLIAEKHWWPQAELWIGYVNAYQLTNHKAYLDVVYKNWSFVKQYILDNKYGEWFWGVDDKYNYIEKDKAGFWKCPYHNARACMELMKRL